MKYWFDTEFIENGETIDLLSIGIVAEDGREFYGQTIVGLGYACNPETAPDWIRENVVPHLTFEGHTRDMLRGLILEFCDPEKHGKPEFWGYYADYDWVVFCQLFGRMIDLPKGFPMYCRDLKQWADMLGNPTLPEQSTTEHHALEDARWNRKAWEFLESVTVTKIQEEGQ